jgi:hypothetical protein
MVPVNVRYIIKGYRLRAKVISSVLSVIYKNFLQFVTVNIVVKRDTFRF